MGSGRQSDMAVSARTTTSGDAAGWVLRSAVAADIEVIAELRATVMRADLERLGRYDEHRVRQRLRDSFSPQHTSIIMIDGELTGCVTVRPAEGRQWLEHFYLAPRCQGRGLGSAVLRTALKRTDAQGMTVGLNVLQGSAARRLYERHGFVVEAQDPIDVFMMRPPASTLRKPDPQRCEGPASVARGESALRERRGSVPRRTAGAGPKYDPAFADRVLVSLAHLRTGSRTPRSPSCMARPAQRSPAPSLRSARSWRRADSQSRTAPGCGCAPWRTSSPTSKPRESG